ncbi:MAG TPA: hypothetical protein VF725_10285 [Ktedonobacterales bacterium]
MGSEGRKRDMTTTRIAGESRVWRLVRARWTLAALVACLTATLTLGYVFVARPAQAASLTVCASASCSYHSINDAIAAAHTGDTITVKAGVYGPNETGVTTTDKQIVINKPLTLIGAGIGKSIINDAAASPGTAVYGVVTIATTTAPGAIKLSGFTIEGANVNDSNNDGVLLSIDDSNAANTITVQNNLFYGDKTLDPSLLADQTDGIVLAQTPGATTITNNQFHGIFRGALVYENPGALTFSNNDLNLHPLYDYTVSPPALQWWAEGIYITVDNTTTVSTPQVVSGNTFESYDGTGIGVNGGYKYGLVGAISNVSITGNTFNNRGVSATSSTPSTSVGVLLHGWGTSSGSLTSTVSGVTVSHNTFNLATSSGQGYGVELMGSLAANNHIDHNLFKGSGSPLAGIHADALAASAGVSITSNRISGFATGVQSAAIAAGASVSASQNCIMGNTTGASVAAGATLTADHNWWGAANGPKPSGSGNAATGAISTSPHLTAPAAICAGPVASGVHASPSPSQPNSDVLLSGQLSDATTGGYAVTSAQYKIDGAAYKTMYASDGSFNSLSETAFVHIWQLTPGTHTFCVRGVDSAGNVGAPSCMTQTVKALAASATATTTATATSTATTTTATDTPTTGPTATDTPSSVTAPGVGGSTSAGSSGSSGSFPLIPVVVGAAILLLIILGIMIWAFSRRRDDGQRLPR